MDKRYYKAPNGAIIEVKEWEGKRVLTTKDVAKIHGLRVNTISYRYCSNKEVFDEGKDFFKLNGNDPKAIGCNASRVMIFTRSGYELIVTQREKDSNRIISEYYDGNNFYFSEENKSDKINVSRETNVRKEKEEENENNVEQKKAEQITVEPLERTELEESAEKVDDKKMFEALLAITKSSLENQNRLMVLMEKQLNTISELLGVKELPTETKEENEETPAEVEEEFPSYIEWKRKITHACGLVVGISKEYTNVNSVLSSAYKILENKYSYCWAEERKNTPRSDGERVRTLNLAYNVELRNRNCRNLLLAVIKDIYEEEKRSNKATA